MQHILYIDSQRRTGGTHSSFSVDLRETLQLNDHGVRVDHCRLTNSFYTTDLGAHIYFKSGTAIQSYTIPERAYTGAQLAAALQTATGRNTTYDPDQNSISQTVQVGGEWLDDAELKTYTSGFPLGASAAAPRSLNQILGESSIVAGNTLVWTFVKMAPFDYLFLRSRRLTVENSEDPSGRHDVLLQIPLTKGIGSVETNATADGII